MIIRGSKPPSDGGIHHLFIFHQAPVSAETCFSQARVELLNFLSETSASPKKQQQPDGCRVSGRVCGSSSCCVTVPPACEQPPLLQNGGGFFMGPLKKPGNHRGALPALSQRTVADSPPAPELVSHHAAGASWLPPAPGGAMLRGRCSSRARVHRHELPGRGGALLLIGDALGQKAEPGRQETETPPRGASPRLAGAELGRAVGH